MIRIGGEKKSVIAIIRSASRDSSRPVEAMAARLHAPALLALLLSVSFVPSHAQDSHFADLFREGTAALQTGHLDEAANEFTRATALNPTFAEGWFNLGLVRMQQEQWDASEAALNKSLALKPALRGAHLFLGIDKYRDNDMPGATAALKKEVAIDPRNPTALMWLGVVQLANGDADDAATSLDAAARLKPGDVDILYHRGRAHMLISKESYDQMYKTDPGSWRVHQVLAESYAQAERQQDAAIECKLAIEMRPKEPGLHQQLGDIYWSENHLDEAEAAYQDELQIDPQSYEAMYKLGVVSLEKSKPEVAAHLLNEALRRAPDSLETHYQLGRAEAQLGQYDSAIRDFSQVVRDPHDVEPETVRQSYYQLSRLYQRTQQPAEAKVALDTFLKLKQQADLQQNQKLEDKMKRHSQTQSQDASPTNN
jgi:tetratricopeptide (TPR) repeat protein